MKTLSNKEITQEQFNKAHQGIHGNPTLYPSEDVKEFIKDLKRNMILQVDIDIIDKLAGEDLL